MPLPEIDFARQLIARLDAGRDRARTARAALGLRPVHEDEPVLPTIPADTFRGMIATQIQVRLLNRGRERNHLRWLAARQDLKSA
jgi:hypothetical protein